MSEHRHYWWQEGRTAAFFFELVCVTFVGASAFERQTLAVITAPTTTRTMATAITSHLIRFCFINSYSHPFSLVMHIFANFLYSLFKYKKNELILCKYPNYL